MTRGVINASKIFDLNSWRYRGTLAKGEMSEDKAQEFRFGIEDESCFCWFSESKCEVGHSEYMVLKFRREVWAGYRNLGVTSSHEPG